MFCKHQKLQKKTKNFVESLWKKNVKVELFLIKNINYETSKSNLEL